ncbi:MAG: DNA topoisomerase III [Rhodocyclaceae bacterium]
MTKELIIAEKPSVAQDIARVLGGFTRHDEYFESGRYVLCSAIGHLLELTVPEEFEVKRGKWSLAHLPVIPPHFELAPIEKTAERLRLLARLVKRKDVAGLINACDAGREGELIFNYIVQHLRSTKPVRRLWLQSMTPQAIREGFAHLRDAAEMRGLAEAAVCRSESDWLIGINGTRAMTAFNSKAGGFHLTTVGRVQTPTLAIMVEREERIRRFVPRDYWEVLGRFGARGGEYAGKWFDERFERTGAGEHERADRLWDEGRAQAIRAKCLGKPGSVEEEAKPATQAPPLLFDLTSLQREANGRFGFSAKATLGLAQALYEKHKVLTYPRTDSRALPEDYIATVKATLGMFAAPPDAKGPGHAPLPEYSGFARAILDAGWVRPNKRIFNDAKVSDHFAIVPTGLAPRHLSEPEARLYDMVTRRFLAVFYPAAEFRITTRITRVAQEAFRTEGKVLVSAGWLAVYGKAKAQGEEGELAPVQPKEKVRTLDVEVAASRTKPPARFSDATLLTAMEGAGKLIEDEELREAMSEKGLGTPATRAQIIENLIAEKYVVRDGRELAPTAKAFQLLTALRGLKIDELCSPELTGDWEFKLKQMEHGKLRRPAFMREISQTARRMVETIKAHQDDDILGDFATLAAPCPKCGGVVKESYRNFQCQSCGYSLWKIMAGRQFEVGEMEALLRERRVGPLAGFRNKMGRPFAAAVRLGDDLQPEFDFGQERGGEEDAEAPDFSGRESLGACPKCGAPVFEHGRFYVCERAAGPAPACDFKTGTVILQQPVEPQQIRRLLASGRTELLRGFVSARTHRRFSAYLVRAADGKVGFEFEPRAKKAPAKPAAPAKHEAAARAAAPSGRRKKRA